LIRVERSLGAVSHYDVRCPPELVDVIVELAKGAGGGHVDSYQQRDTKEYSRNGQNRTGTTFWKASRGDFRGERFFHLIVLVGLG